MDLGGSLVIVAAALASVSANSLPGIPFSPVIHRKIFGPGLALMSDLKW